MTKYIKTDIEKKINVYFLGSYKEQITRVIYKSRFTTALYCKYKGVYHKVSVTPRNEYFIITRIND